MINRLVIIYGILYLLIYVILFKGFTLFPLSSGDWWYYFSETLRDFSLLPSSWNNEFGVGLGSNQTFFMNINSYFTTTSAFFHNSLGIPWTVIERIFWFYPFLILTFVSSFYLYKTVFGSKFFGFVIFASGVYLLNTYALMLIGGGQLGVAMAYAIAPLTVALFLKTFVSKNIHQVIFKSIAFGLILAVTIMFDVRIAYVTLVLCGVYGVIKLSVLRSLHSVIRIGVFSFLIPGLITLLLHLWWILPYLFSPQSPIGSLDTVYTSEESVKFFSFADFSHALSLLHPNWPENVFGKVSFLRPEFLILPILAFSSLLFLPNIKDKTQNRKLYILFFALIGILGAFLAKGAQEPFGFVYLWMFENIPGFIMFRDPTKWYVLIAISYAMLIPFSVSQIYQWLKEKQVFSIQYSVFRKYITLPNIFLLFVVFYFMFLLRPAWMGELGGTFKPSPVPPEYIQLKDFLHEDEQFSRTLWVPQKQRFGFTSNTHPGVSAQNFFNVSSVSGVLDALSREETLGLLQSTSVRYVIVPYDSKGELFLTDRKFDAREYEKTVAGLDGVDWLSKTQSFGDIIVYEVLDPKDHFYTDGIGRVLSWERVSATEYTVTLNSDAQTLVFSEGYDPGWVAYANGQEIISEEYNTLLNSFKIPNGAEDIRVYYSPQKYVVPGLLVSGVTIVVLIGTLVVLKRRFR